MKRSLILNILILLLMFSFCGCVDDNNGSDSDWGEEGDLEITISANKNAIKINESLIVTITYQNKGSTDLRILHIGGINAVLFDSNNSSVKFIGPIDDRALYNNDDLDIVRSRSTKSYSCPINNYNWDLKINETYKVLFYYKIYSEEEITLPFWKEELWSNEIYFKVLP